ncbi:CGNR zinc finger domain-containing protein [Nonomuraea sp. 3N208]|uniref:CGNR zinc finger domain-containing protein n=1 Tax=Nonomuraea sp. 3N208 TaxID=3457421 RepID=UPI003FCC477E
MTRPPAASLMAFPFIGGRPCLDFVATLGKRHAVPVERLPNPAALGRWIHEAGLSPDVPQATIEHLTDALGLREAIYQLLRAAIAGRPVDPADVALTNAVAANPDLAPQLSVSGDLPSISRQSADVTPAALATVARDAVLLLGGPLLERVKECENPDCSLLFLDDSQARRRRWCSMDRCGNLAKIAGYRSRTRARPE